VTVEFVTNIFVGILVILGGGFCILSSIKNWDFFFNSSKAWLIIKLFGRNGARILYSIIGIAFAIFGVAMIFYIK